MCFTLYCLTAKTQENRLNLASKYNMAAIIPLCITKKSYINRVLLFLCWKSTSFEFIGVDVSQIFGLERWHQIVSLAGELVWLFVMTVHCKITFFLRGQMKLKFAGSVQGALCYWQYKGRSGMPKVSVICCLNIHWSLGEHTWHFALPFCLGWLLLTWASSFIFYTLFSVVQSTLSKYGDSILIGISVCPSIRPSEELVASVWFVTHLNLSSYFINKPIWRKCSHVLNISKMVLTLTGFFSFS